MPSLRPNFIFRGARLAAQTTSRPTSVFRLVDALDAGKDRAVVLAAEAQREFQQLLGPGHVFGGDDPHHPQIDLGELVEADRLGQRLGQQRGVVVEGHASSAGASASAGSALSATIASTAFGSTRWSMCANLPTGVPKSGCLRLAPNCVIGSPSSSPVCSASFGSTGDR